jgi:tryptophan halogenase
MENINSILIVGGGSSGWITASFLKKTFPEKTITVIESPNHPIIGVGESTLADITNFRDYLNINEKEFMKATDASYKMSIKFTDFYNKDSGGFHYPFRTPDVSNTHRGLRDWFEIKAFYPQTEINDFVRCYFPHSYLFENNKYTLNNNGEFGSWDPKKDVGYHFDAVKFGIWLRENYCKPRGVIVISDDVVNAELNDDGIKTLVLKSGQKIEADLYIDCTGFKSLLLGEYLKEPFTSYSEMLPNNSAWAAQVQYVDKEKELEPFTNGTAIGNGWCWNTPLWSRLGTGYVYSNKFISKEDALEEFKQYLMSNKMVVPRTKLQVEELSFRHLEMRIGKHRRTWVKNVVAIGLSAGFIEPLESNGLFSVFWYVEKLAKTLLRGPVSRFDIDSYNLTTQGIYDNLAEFVALHYALSLRRDTEYWKDISKKVYSKDMINYTVPLSVGFCDLQNKKMFTHFFEEKIGITYISAGMNYPLFDKVDLKMDIFDQDITSFIDQKVYFFEERKKRWKKAAEKAPSLFKYLQKYIYTND